MHGTKYNKTEPIHSRDYIGKILGIVAISWLPLFLFQIIMNKVDPSDYQKVMRTVKRQAINYTFSLK